MPGNLKINPLNLQFFNQAKNISMDSEFPNQNSRKISQEVPELWSHIQTSKQRLLLYVYRLRFLQIKLLLGAINGSLSAEIPFVLMHPSPRDRWGWDGTLSPKDRWGWDGTLFRKDRWGWDGTSSQEICEGGMPHCPQEKFEGWMAQLPWTS